MLILSHVTLFVVGYSYTGPSIEAVTERVPHPEGGDSSVRRRSSRCSQGPFCQDASQSGDWAGATSEDGRGGVEAEKPAFDDPTRPPAAMKAGPAAAARTQYTSR
jgi:hypothetical protein